MKISPLLFPLSIQKPLNIVKALWALVAIFIASFLCVNVNAATVRYMAPEITRILEGENSNEFSSPALEVVFDSDVPAQDCFVSGEIAVNQANSTATEGLDFSIPNKQFTIDVSPNDGGGVSSDRFRGMISAIDDGVIDGVDQGGRLIENINLDVTNLQSDCGFNALDSEARDFLIEDNGNDQGVMPIEAELEIFIDDYPDNEGYFEAQGDVVTLEIDLIFNESRRPIQNCSISGEIAYASDSDATEGADFTISTRSFTIPYSPDDESEGSSGEKTRNNSRQSTTPQFITVNILDDDFVDGQEDESGLIVETLGLQLVNITSDCDIDIVETYGESFYIFDDDSEGEGENPEPVFMPLSERAGLNKLQRSVAEALDNSCSALSSLVGGEGEVLNINSNEQSLLSICNQLQSSNSLTSDLNELSPKKFSAMRELAIRGGMQQNQNLSKQLARTRQGERGINLSDLSLNVYGQRLAGRYVGEALGAGAGDDIQSDWSAFVGGSVQIGEYDQQDFDLQGNNIYAGLNYQLNSTVIVGAALGYNQSDANFNSKGNEIEFESYNIALLGSYYVNDDFYLDSVFTYGVNDYGTDRRVVIGLNRQQNEGKTDGSEMTFAVNTGYTLNTSNAFFTFFAALNYVDADIDEFDEEVKGSSPLLGSLLIIEDQDFKSFTTNLGLEFGLTLSTPTGVIVPKLSLDWEQQHEDEAGIISTQFLADPTNTSWDVTTQVADDNYYNASLSLNAVFKNGFSTYIVYDTELGREDISMYEVSLGARWEF
ncbi:MAG: autotransporter outer membrane beta-barrel domain-containing protein [Cellvibrionaceae bacterium]